VTEPATWGLTDKDDPAKDVLQCLDPAEHTGGGTVVFQIKQREPAEE
jgi:hypothetical protein